MILLPAASLFVAIFFLNIKNEYRKTFWSTKWGKDMTLGLMDSTKDSTKAKIFLKNCRHLREEIIIRSKSPEIVFGAQQ